MEGVAAKEKPESKGTSVKFGWIKGVLVSADDRLPPCQGTIARATLG